MCVGFPSHGDAEDPLHLVNKKISPLLTYYLRAESRSSIDYLWHDLGKKISRKNMKFYRLSPATPLFPAWLDPQSEKEQIYEGSKWQMHNETY